MLLESSHRLLLQGDCSRLQHLFRRSTRCRRYQLSRMEEMSRSFKGVVVTIREYSLCLHGPVNYKMGCALLASTPMPECGESATTGKCKQSPMSNEAPIFVALLPLCRFSNYTICYTFILYMR